MTSHYASAPSLAPLRDPTEVVPVDTGRRIRIMLLSFYAIGYLWYLRNVGLPLDRISVTISVGIFLLCAFIGRPWHTWARLGVDICAYLVMWFAYDQTRGMADNLGTPRQLQMMRNIDRFLFFGNDPSVWMQRHFRETSIRWYEKVFSLIYFTHFIFPIVAICVLWYASHRQWVRFMKRFATLMGVACVMFVMMPTIPPWMAASKQYRALPELAHNTGRGFTSLGFRAIVKTWQRALDWGNPVAAMPSLHTSYALIVPAFFLPWIRPRWLKALVLCFPVLMLTSLVYFAEHWVIDGIVGALIVGASFWFWNWREQRVRTNRVLRARAALGETT